MTDGSVLVLPDDEHNRLLVNNVHPPGWVNPEPTGRYHLVVIGAGTAGLVMAAVASALGARVALIEKHLMGGDCLNVGCVPSKGVIAASRVWAVLRHGSEFGILGTEGIRYDFGMVMERMRKLRARISAVDSAYRFRSLGVDVFIGEGHFTGSDTVEVKGDSGDRALRFGKAAICTGARAAAPSIPGLREAGYLTNETVFSLTDRPPRLAVIGAGPVGCELAQAFARFGSQVHLIETQHGVLPREDRDAAETVRQSMRRDGVQVLCCGTELAIRKDDGKRLTVDSHGRRHEITVDEILVAVGRAPNVEGLGLDAVGVGYDAKSGVKVNDRLQTSVPNIFAAGDVCFPLQFTHAADATAQVVIQNALFPHPFGLGYASTRSLIIPWTTYTKPEIAHVGLYEAEAERRGIEVDTFTHHLDEVDRAIVDGEDEGFARVHVIKGTDKILGATVVAAHAGDLISEFTLAMRNGLGLSAIAGTIHPYPTQAEVIRKVAYAWRKSTFTERKRRILKRWFAWRR